MTVEAQAVCKRGSLPGTLHGPLSQAVVACISDQAWRQVGSSWDGTPLERVQKLCTYTDPSQDSTDVSMEIVSKSDVALLKERHDQQKRVKPMHHSTRLQRETHRSLDKSYTLSPVCDCFRAPIKVDSMCLELQQTHTLDLLPGWEAGQYVALALIAAAVHEEAAEDITPRQKPLNSQHADHAGPLHGLLLQGVLACEYKYLC